MYRIEGKSLSELHRMSGGITNQNLAKEIVLGQIITERNKSREQYYRGKCVKECAKNCRKHRKEEFGLGKRTRRIARGEVVSRPDGGTFN